MYCKHKVKTNAYDKPLTTRYKLVSSYPPYMFAYICVNKTK